MKRCVWCTAVLSVLMIPFSADAGMVDIAGVDDNFANGPDIAYPSDAVRAALAMYSGTQDFDLVPGDTTGAASPNRQVVHTFPAFPTKFTGAKLDFRARAGETSGTENDGIFLSFTAPGTVDYLESVVYRRSFGALPATPPSYPEADPGLVGYWNDGTEAEISLDLSRLPLPDGSTLDLIPMLQANNYLDVCVSDETGVDFFRMSFEVGREPVAPIVAIEAEPRLQANAPNPFRRSTNMAFSLQRSTNATIRVLDVSGRLVRTIHQGPTAAGEHTASWDGRDESGSTVTAGVYFYRLESQGFSETRKMIFVR